MTDYGTRRERHKAGFVANWMRAHGYPWMRREHCAPPDPHLMGLRYSHGLGDIERIETDAKAALAAYEASREAQR